MSTLAERVAQRADLDENGEVNIGPPDEMRAKWLKEQFIHEAALRAVGIEPDHPVFTAAETNPPESPTPPEPEHEDEEFDATEEPDDLDTKYGD